MIEAYAVAVRVRLINGVTAGLMSMSSAFARVHGDATKLQRQLDSIKFKLAAGGALVAAGAFGFYLLDKAVKPAEEYAHQLNIMHMAGMSNLDIARATGDAWRNTGTVITTTATQNLRAILDLKNILGTMKDAEWALPIVTKVGAVMASSSEGAVSSNAQDIAFSMAKALDIIGAARDPKTFAREASLMSKVVTAFQNRVTPKQFQGVFQYARQAKFDLSDEFKYEFLPSLMLEMSSGSNSSGGGSRGVGPMLAAIYRVTNQGYINKKAVPLWEKLGLVGKGTALKTSTEGTVTDPLKDRRLAAQNPFLFATTVLEPAIKRAFGQNIGKDREREIIGELFRGNQLAAAAMMEFISKPQNYLRDQQIIRHAMPYGQAYEQARKNDPNFQWTALHAQYENALTALGIAVLPIVIKGVRLLAEILQPVGAWMMQHATLTKTLVLGFAALSGAMLFGGTVLLLSAAFSAIALVVPVLAAGFGVLAVGIGAISLPVLAVIAGVAALGLALWKIAKNWDTTKSVLQNIWNEFGMFFKWLGDKVAWLFGLKNEKDRRSDWEKQREKILARDHAAAKLQTDAWNHFHKSLRAAEGIDPSDRANKSQFWRKFPASGTANSPTLLGNVPKTVYIRAASLLGGAPAANGPWGPRAPQPGDKDFFGPLLDKVRDLSSVTKQGEKDVAADLKTFMTQTLAEMRNIASSMTIHMDGQTVGRIVAGHQGNVASRPSTGPSSFDTLLSPLRPDMAL